MVSRKMRHARILDLVASLPVSSQNRLSELLSAGGVKVTQSTLSRDIRELGLVKVRGVYHAAPNAPAAPHADALRRSLQQFVVASGLSGNILMVRTAPGNAHSVGVVLDAARWPEVLGTVAGDDTVFILLRSTRVGKKVLKRIESCLS